DVESEITRGLNCLDRGSPGSANVIHNNNARAFFLEAFDLLCCSMLLFRLADQKAIQFSACHRNGGHDRVRAQGQSTYCLRSPAPTPDLFQKNLGGESCPFGVERSRAAIDVIIAVGARRKLKFPETKALGSQQSQQF